MGNRKNYSLRRRGECRCLTHFVRGGDSRRRRAFKFAVAELGAGIREMI